MIFLILINRLIQWCFVCFMLGIILTVMSLAIPGLVAELLYARNRLVRS